MTKTNEAYIEALQAKYQRYIKLGRHHAKTSERYFKKARSIGKLVIELDIEVPQFLEDLPATSSFPASSEGEKTEVPQSSEEEPALDAPQIGSADHPLELETPKAPKNEHHKKILELDAEGMAVKDIAEKVGLTVNAIYYVLKQYRPQPKPE